MKLWGICLVKNEDDIISQTLTYATRYCDRIFVLDNGSTDETWTIVQHLARQHAAIVPFGQTLEPYHDTLRHIVYDAVRHERADDDWWLYLDADEFLAEDPRPVLETAIEEGADVVNAWQIVFYFTEKDLEAWQAGKDRRDIPIFDRRRYYRIDHQEYRLLRVQIRSHPKKVCRRRIFNRHYQYRDPEQIEKRLRLRYDVRLRSGHFPYVRSTDWRSAVRDSRRLNFHRDGEPWHFSASGLLHYYATPDGLGYYLRYYRQVARAKYDGALRRVRALLRRLTIS